MEVQLSSRRTEESQSLACMRSWVQLSTLNREMNELISNYEDRYFVDGESQELMKRACRGGGREEIMTHLGLVRGKNCISSDIQER